MKELVVLGGHPGAGKTLIMAALAGCSQGPVLVDCDFTAGGLDLFLGAVSERRFDFVGEHKAVVLPDACDACGICHKRCRYGAVIPPPDNSLHNSEAYYIEPHHCNGCAICVGFCPTDAIELEDVVSGQWWVSQSYLAPVVSGRTSMGYSDSGKLVRLLKKEAGTVAEEQDRKLVIVDGPTGSGESILAALSGADFALVVAEPARGARRELKKLLRLVRQSGVKAGLCVNKSDVDTDFSDRIVAFSSRKFQIDTVGRIPSAGAAGTDRHVVLNDLGFKAGIQDLWQSINESVKLERSRRRHTA